MSRGPDVVLSEDGSIHPAEGGPALPFALEPSNTPASTEVGMDPEPVDPPRAPQPFEAAMNPAPQPASDAALPPSSPKALESLLFGGSSDLSSPSADLPPPSLAPGAPMPRVEVVSEVAATAAPVERPWPESVPDEARALRILRGEEPPPATLQAMHEELVRLATDPERRALAPRPADAPPEEAEIDAAFALVQRGLVLRFRLRAALLTRPAADSVNEEAYVALMKSTSEIVDVLGNTAAPTPELIDAFSEGRTSLVRIAVALGELHNGDSSLAVFEGLSRSIEEKPVAKARSSSNIGRPKREVQRQTTLAIVLALSVVGAVVFHSTREPPPQAAQVAEWTPGLPTGTVGQKDEKTGALVVRIVEPDRRDAVLKELATYAEANGLHVQELSASVVSVVPKVEGIERLDEATRAVRPKTE